MHKLNSKVFFFILCFLSYLLPAQEYPDDLSNGKLIINQKEVLVKIYANSSNYKLQNEINNNIDKSILVLLSESNTEQKSEEGINYAVFVLNEFKKNGYQVLDQNFQPYDNVNVDTTNLTSAKYLYKSKINPIKSGSNVSLETKFTVWNPKTGIDLGPFKLHFYSLMFVIAFGLGYFIMSKIFKIDNVDEKYLEPFFTWTIVGTIFGARIGHVLFYERELLKEDFWSVFLPIRTVPEFEFTGFSGLASHGAAIALIFTTLYYAVKIIKKNPFWVYDRIGIVVAIGGAFVRLGNFFNSEIIGKPVAEDSPFAVLFTQMSTDYGATVPRYPTQLFEAFGYVCLFVILWLFYKYTNKKRLQGWLFGLFFVLLWAIRFLVEFLKEPQGEEYITIGNLNTGQVLSIPFILAGMFIMWYSQFNKEKTI